MLKFIIGTNEKARREYLYSEMKKDTAELSYLIVPEQFSFESEKLLYDRLGTEAAQKVEVLSFSRLCNSIFRTFGGLAGEYTDDTAKLLLMSAALSQSGELKYYKKNIFGASFIKELVETDSELKNAGITPTELIKISENSKSAVLSDKASDLATIFSLYDAILSKSYLDPLTDISRACDILSENDFFSGKAVYIDNFTGFTGSEYKMLEAIIGQADLVTVSLCCPDIYDREGTSGLFSKTKRTAGRLEKIAKELSVKICSPVHAVSENDERPGGIADIESCFLQRENAPAHENSGEVTVITANDPYDEANFVACKIIELVRNENLRWRDMAVIARDLTPYIHALPVAFEKAGIPLYMDTAADLSSHPFSAFISASLSACRNNFDIADVLRALKTGILPLTNEETAEFENYCFVWNIRGKALLSEFTGNPEGFSESSDFDTAALERINRVRELIAVPLEKLKNRIASADGEAFSAALYDYVSECKVIDGLKALYEKYSEEGDISTAESLDSYWSFFVSLLDKFSLSLRGINLESDMLSRLFELALSEAKIGTLPQTLDCVPIGTADRMRPSSPKAVFVIGVCDGVFPAKPRSGGLFTDSERKEMFELDVKLYDDENDGILSERMYAYTAFTSPEKHLFVSWCKRGSAFEEQSRSVLISETLRAAVPAFEMSTAELPETFWLCSEEFAFERLSGFSGEPTPEIETVKKYFSESPLWSERSKRLGKLVLSSDYTLSPEIAESIFGKNMRFSPTSIKNYKNCPFLYYLYSGLHIKDIGKAELNPLSTGNLVHFVLQTLVKKYNGEGLFSLSDTELRSEISGVFSEYIKTVFNTEKDKTNRFLYLLGKIEELLFVILRRIGEEFKVSGFVPYAFELPLDDSGEVPAYSLGYGDGKNIKVSGKVDRIDTFECGGKKYARVVDYKTGSVSTGYSDIYYGNGIQSLIYLFSIENGGKGGLSNSDAAGALYMPVGAKTESMDKDDIETLGKDAVQRSFRYDGFILDDDAVINAMDPEAKYGFIPQKKGARKTSSPFLLSDEFKAVKTHIDSLLIDMAVSLSSGKIGAMPYRSGGNTPCEYCQYRSVCRRNENEPFYDRPSIDRPTFFEKAKGGEENG